MNHELREKLRLYGPAFDEMVDSVGEAMGDVGYRSRHAPARRAEMKYDSNGIRSLVSGLGILCLRMNNEFRDQSPSREVDDIDTLAVAAEIGRLISLLREGQKTRALTGRAAFELDGDIDELEERFLRLDDFAALVEAARSIVISSRPFLNSLPEVIKDSFFKLESHLSMSA